MAKKSESGAAPEILEQGDIYFLYRPKVRSAEEAEERDGNAAAEDIDDVQNFCLVLKPQGGRFRLINVGRKRLPDIEGHERNWGFVEMVADSGQEIEEVLRRDTYDTETRGERVLPAARPAGEGVYALVREGSRMHLAWALELPKKPGPVQRAFNVPGGGEPRDLDRQSGKEGRAAHRAIERGAAGPLSQVAAEGVSRAQVRD
jgi:hypothetical protein